MPRFNVPLPDGKWIVYSTICDDYVSEPMTFDELREWRRREYGEHECSDEDTYSLLTDNPTINRMTYEEAEWRRKLNL